MEITKNNIRLTGYYNFPIPNTSSDTVR